MKFLIGKMTSIFYYSVMSKIVGYMLTWTTYGSWLPGDKRKYVQDGKIMPPDKTVLESNKKRLKAKIVKLANSEQEIVKQTILSEAKRIGQIIEGIVVYSNHVHLLVRPHSESIEKTVGRYKSITTKQLWIKGRQGRVWTKGYDTRFCFKEEDITVKKQYINKH
jgi:REP element-mobilizing transposase RayT